MPWPVSACRCWDVSSVSSFAVDKELNVFNHHSPRDLARKIDFFIDHPDIAKENGEKYLGLAAKFDFQTSMDKMEKMYLEVIEKSKK